MSPGHGHKRPAPGLTPNSIQQKCAQTVVSTPIAPGCVQFLGGEKRFHTAWVMDGRRPQCKRNLTFSAKRSGAAMYPACFRLEDCLHRDAAAVAAGPDVIR